MRYLLCTVMTFLASADGLPASVIINVQEVGNDVVASYSGTVDLGGLTFRFRRAASHAYLIPRQGGIAVGPRSNADFYLGHAAPAPFGTGNLSFAYAATGDFLNFSGPSANNVLVPAGYVSGAPLSGSATWINQSFTSLRVTPGTYTYNWGSGANADFATLQIGPAVPVPEPSTFAQLAIGLAGCAAYTRRQRQTKAS